ncbi:MFS general substrate transporter [Venustampulla echinocandica]|uniref:MFS general substrate transporter n=1 Tax=Venustampulla echinocandica TaxID=2656787 RepID=A0A370TZ89_9HELO|nr:MFS general substrate transporter [Venustampulla echinocandica]RDL40853.1 MFS general substrate transporter [Venustampulla echinocandica]
MGTTQRHKGMGLATDNKMLQSAALVTWKDQSKSSIYDMDCDSEDEVDLLLASSRSPIGAATPLHNADTEESPKFKAAIPSWALLNKSSSHETVSTTYLILLTCGTFGLQNVWSLLLANGTPYLLSIGFSRSITALIWVAGPLSGTFVQPFVGAISDQYVSRWGKRKPFIVAGIAGAVLSIMGMAIMRISATRIYIWFARDYVGPHTMANLARVFVILWICILNLSLQPLQVGLRSLIIDACPSHQQSQASAWSGRFTGLGGIATYLLDDFLIRRYQDRTFEVLCIVTSLSLIITNLPCILLIRERRGSLETVPDRQTFWLLRLAKRLIRTTRRMPASIKYICMVQFTSWLGWFPFLYYNTTYISSLDLRQTDSEETPNSSGVQAYLIFAIVSFYCSVVLPWTKPSASRSSNPVYPGSKMDHLGKYINIILPRLWFFSQILFAICMLSTMVISDTLGGTFMVAIVGISWALTQWIPLALMSAEIANLRDAKSCEFSQEEGDGDDETGSLMSLFNVAISAPQILAGILCSGLFWLLGGAGTGDSLGWALRMGGIASIISAFLMVWLKR